jgi:hypothetical protein
MHIFNDHFSFIGMINLLLGGILLSVLYLNNRNLWLIIGLHFSWNFTQGTVFGFNVSGFENSGIFSWLSVGETKITGGHFGLEGSYLTTILLLIILSVVNLSSIERFNPTWLSGRPISQILGEWSGHTGRMWCFQVEF